MIPVKPATALEASLVQTMDAVASPVYEFHGTMDKRINPMDYMPQHLKTIADPQVEWIDLEHQNRSEKAQAEDVARYSFPDARTYTILYDHPSPPSRSIEPPPRHQEMHLPSGAGTQFSAMRIQPQQHFVPSYAPTALPVQYAHPYVSGMVYAQGPVITGARSPPPQSFPPISGPPPPHSPPPPSFPSSHNFVSSYCAFNEIAPPPPPKSHHHPHHNLPAPSVAGPSPTSPRSQQHLANPQSSYNAGANQTHSTASAASTGIKSRTFTPAAGPSSSTSAPAVPISNPTDLSTSAEGPSFRSHNQQQASRSCRYLGDTSHSAPAASNPSSHDPSHQHVKSEPGYNILTKPAPQKPWTRMSLFDCNRCSKTLQSTTNPSCKEPSHKLMRIWVMEDTIEAVLRLSYSKCKDVTQFASLLRSAGTEFCSESVTWESLLCRCNELMLEQRPRPSIKPVMMTSRGQMGAEVFVFNYDSLDVGVACKGAGFNPCVLNMGNAHRRGGGYLSGAGAQEESIFRRTNLFHLLATQSHWDQLKHKFGIECELQAPKVANNATEALAEAETVYTKNVVVFRGSERKGYAFLSRPATLDIVTGCGLDLKSVTWDEIKTRNIIESILLRAYLEGNDCVVLGPIGCGAFQNPPDAVASIFKEVLYDREMARLFNLVVFAIIDDHNSKRTLATFNEFFTPAGDRKMSKILKDLGKARLREGSSSPSSSSSSSSSSSNPSTSTKSTEVRRYFKLPPAR